MTAACRDFHLNSAREVLAALPPGSVLTTVPDVARRLCKRKAGWCPEWADHTTEAKRLLGVTE